MTRPSTFVRFACCRNTLVKASILASVFAVAILFSVISVCGQQRILAITGATVIDPVTGKGTDQTTILISGGKIVKVGKDRSIKPPRNAVVYKADGKFVIPGLWDMHVHAFNNFSPSRSGTDNKDSYFPLFLANGVTGIRDMASDSEDRKLAGKWRSEMNSGGPGPRVEVGSNIIDGDPPFLPGPVAIKDPNEARAAVRRMKADGAQYIKIYWMLSPATFDAIADEAKKVGIPIVGHVPFSMSAFAASNRGLKSIEHLTGTLETCSSKEDELRAKEWTPEVDKEMKATFDMQKCRRLFSTFKRNGTFSVPTAVLHRGMLLYDDYGFRTRPALEYISATEVAEWEASPQLVRGPDLADRQRDFELLLRVVGAMHEEGAPLLAGTDNNNPFVVPGFDLHDELEIFVRAGLTPTEALRTATWNPAVFFGKTKEFGTVAAGKAADLVILTADPRLDIRNTRKIDAVVSNAVLFDRKELDKMLAKAKSSPRK
ncbi:MAG: amidohydrolase family protein [Acidobacteria bacterium]|nr:amidohydrolase family protein [Acidobacteriota bacterium]